VAGCGISVIIRRDKTIRLQSRLSHFAGQVIHGPLARSSPQNQAAILVWVTPPAARRLAAAGQPLPQHSATPPCFHLRAACCFDFSAGRN